MVFDDRFHERIQVVIQILKRSRIVPELLLIQPPQMIQQRYLFARRAPHHLRISKAQLLLIPDAVKKSRLNDGDIGSRVFHVQHVPHRRIHLPVARDQQPVRPHRTERVGRVIARDPELAAVADRIGSRDGDQRHDENGVRRARLPRHDAFGAVRERQDQRQERRNHVCVLVGLDGIEEHPRDIGGDEKRDVPEERALILPKRDDADRRDRERQWHPRRPKLAHEDSEKAIELR